MEDDSCLVSNVALQLGELDMLAAMLNADEMIVDQPEHVIKMRAVVEENLEFKQLNTSLSFTIKLPITITNNELANNSSKVVEMQVGCNENYPNCQMLDIYVKSASFSRDQQREINQNLQEHLKTTWAPGELMVGNALTWTQEHVANSFENSEESRIEKGNEISKRTERVQLTRLWIYSHHIYSKIKRKNILDLASDYNITGFSMPGKPGIICLEGSDRDVGDVWASIKSWNWKRINVKVQEEIDCQNYQKMSDERRFGGFEEIGIIKNAEARDYHMDMSKFCDYLREHASQYIFKELFGFDKK